MKNILKKMTTLVLAFACVAGSPITAHAAVEYKDLGEIRIGTSCLIEFTPHTDTSTGYVSNETGLTQEEMVQAHNQTVDFHMNSKFSSLVNRSYLVKTKVINTDTSTVIVEKGTINSTLLKDFVQHGLDRYQNGSGTRIDYTKDRVAPFNSSAVDVDANELSEVKKTFMGFTIGSFGIGDGYGLHFKDMSEELKEYLKINTNTLITTRPDISTPQFKDFYTKINRLEKIDDYVDFTGLSTNVGVYHITEYKIVDIEIGKKEQKNAHQNFNVYVKDENSGEIIATATTNRFPVRILFDRAGTYNVQVQQKKSQVIRNEYVCRKVEYLVLEDTGQVIWKKCTTTPYYRNSETSWFFETIGEARGVVTAAQMSELWIDRTGNIIELQSTERIE